MSRFRHVLVLVPVLAVLAFAPASAHAGVHCVGMGAACPAGGTAQPTFAAAVTATNLVADEDTIYVGPIAETLAATVVVAAGRPTHIVGSGAAATTITGPSNDDGLIIDDPDSDVRDIGFVTRGVSFVGQCAVTFSGGAGPRAVGQNIRVRGVSASSGQCGVRFEETGIVRNLDVELAQDTTTANTGVLVNATDAFTAVIEDSRIVARRGFDVQGSAHLVLRRSTLDYSGLGIRLLGNSRSSSATFEESVIRVRHLPSSGGTTDTATVSSTTLQDLPVSARLRIIHSTVIGPSDDSRTDNFATVTSNTSSGTSDLSARSLAAVSLDHTVVTGAFDKSVITNEAATVGGSYANETSFQAAHSSIDLAPSKFTALGVGTPTLIPAANGGTVVNFAASALAFVDAAAGDVRPRWGSSLIDAGDAVPASARVRGPRLDIGAYEYQYSAPAVTAAASAVEGVSPGDTVTVSAAATDADPGETAALSYAWALPGGGTAAGPTATFVLPKAKPYVASVTVTDPAGVKTVVPVTISASTADDKVAPMLTFGKLKASLKVLRARKAASFAFELSEAATMKATATVNLFQPTKTRKLKLVKIPMATVTTVLGSGKRSIKLVPTKAAAAKLAKALKVKGTRAASAHLTGTVTDASGNKRAFTIPVALAK